MTTTKPARPAFIAIPKPDRKLLDELNYALVSVQLKMQQQTQKVVDLDYDPENGMYPALAFAALSKLLVDLKYARPVAEPPLALPHLGAVHAGDPPAKKVVKRKPKVLANSSRFDFGSLPPRVEAGC